MGVKTVAHTNMSHFAQYTLERTDRLVLEDERGFATYVFYPECVYIEDVYVAPEFRRNGVASEFVETIEKLARSRSITKCAVTVAPQAKTCMDSLKAVIALNFKLIKADNSLLYFERNIE